MPANRTLYKLYHREISNYSFQIVDVVIAMSVSISSKSGKVFQISKYKKSAN
ncbi:hypothetical protein H6G64_08080 [Calothrix sp. FACHB-156]|nr:hypothetical protein [Calothrix sp. FACHB-156]